MYRRIALILFTCTIFLISNEVSAETVKGRIPDSSFTLTAVNSESSSIFMKPSESGKEIEFRVRVKNVSRKEKEFTLYPTDLLPSVGGGWSYHPSTVKPTLMGTWFKDKPVKEVLKAGTSKDYKFTMKVPGGIENGQYIGAIVLEEFTPADMKKAVGMSIGSDMYVRLPLQTVVNIKPEDAKHSMEIGQISHEVKNNGLVTIHIPHINKGTILEKPSGTLTLIKSPNEVLKREPYQMDSVYVKTTGLYDMDIPEMLAPGDYILKYQTQYQQETILGEYRFKVSPSDLLSSMDKADNAGNPYNMGIWEFIKEFWTWILLVISIIVILLIVIIILLLRRRKENNQYPQRGGRTSC